jgi:hypothetical protein
MKSPQRAAETSGILQNCQECPGWSERHALGAGLTLNPSALDGEHSAAPLALKTTYFSA